MLFMQRKGICFELQGSLESDGWQLLCKKKKKKKGGMGAESTCEHLKFILGLVIFKLFLSLYS